MSLLMPEYMRIRQYIINRVQQVEELEKLPSERKMCEMFKVSRETIRRAVSDLVKEGILISQPRRGYFIKSKEKKLPTKTIGIIFSQGINVQYNPNFLQILEGICAGLSERLATAEFINISSVDRLPEEITNQHLDGLLWVIPKPQHFKFCHEIDERSNFPLMTISFTQKRKSGNYIHNDYAKGIVKAVNYLFQLKHKKILYFGYNPKLDSGFFLEQYKQTLKTNGIHYDKNLTIYDSTTIETRLKRLLKKRPLPFSSIFCRGVFCKMIYSAAEEIGLRIPADFSLITEENTFTLGLKENPTRLRRPHRDMGYEAALNLMDIVENKITKPVQIEFKWKIHKGNSCKGAKYEK